MLSGLPISAVASLEKSEVHSTKLEFVDVTRRTEIVWMTEETGDGGSHAITYSANLIKWTKQPNMINFIPQM